jgi:polyisoprenoid-binding protein YceI
MIPAVALALLGIASAAPAAPLTFDIDKPHTQIGFSIRHFFAKVQGRFQDFGGTIVYDEKNLPASTVNVIIQAASVFTDNEKRDAHLRTGDFFAADSFPTLTFKSARVVPAGKSRFKVYGDLTLHGVTKPVVLDAEFLGMGQVSLGGHSMGTKAGFDATTTVNRQDFGIRWNKTLDQGGLMLGDDVDISLHVEANLAEGEKK